MCFRQMPRAGGIDLSIKYTHNGESFQRQAKLIAGHRKLLCYRTSHCITHTAIHSTRTRKGVSFISSFGWHCLLYRIILP